MAVRSVPHRHCSGAMYRKLCCNGTDCLPRSIFQNTNTEHTVNKLLAALLLAAPIVFNPAFAATEQQSKMTACNKEAGGKKGEERKAFMKECLSNKPADSGKQPTATQKAQQDKMKTCNAEAKGMKGDERKKFMGDCLKKG
jgi:hypothetical protein